MPKHVPQHPMDRQAKVRVKKPHVKGWIQEKSEEPKSPEIARRDVLRAGMFGSIGLATVGMTGVLGGMFWPTKMGAFGGVVSAGNIADYPPGTVKKVAAGKFYLSRLPSGELTALYWKCVHLGCTVPWEEAEGRFHCPCHNSVYLPTGQNVSGPAPRPLDIMEVTVDADGRVSVNTGNIRERTAVDLDDPFIHKS